MILGLKNRFKLFFQVFNHLYHYLAIDPIYCFDFWTLNLGSCLWEVFITVAVQSHFFLRCACIFYFGSSWCPRGKLNCIQLAIRPFKDFKVDYVLQLDEVDHQLVCLAHPIVRHGDGRFLIFFELFNFDMVILLPLYADGLLRLLLDFRITLEVSFKLRNLPCNLLDVSL